MMNISFKSSGGQQQSLLARIVGSVIGVIALIGAFMFSAVVFVAVAIIALALWGWFWWKTRALRKQMQAQMAEQGFATRPESPAQNGEIIEGEAVRLDDERQRLQ